MRLGHERFVEEAAGDPCLVGHDDQREARALEHPQGVHGVGEDLEALQPVEVTDLFDEGAIAVEEHGSGHEHSSCGAGTR